MHSLSCIVAVGKNGEIGKNNSLPWGVIKEDMYWFVKNTEHKPIVMGYNTFESLNKKPLKHRLNIVLTSKDINNEDNLIFVKNHEKILNLNYNTKTYGDEIMVMGGSKIYDLYDRYYKKVYLTTIDKDFPEADTYLSFHKQLFNLEVWEQLFIHKSVTVDGVGLTFRILSRRR